MISDESLDFFPGYGFYVSIPLGMISDDDHKAQCSALPLVSIPLGMISDGHRQALIVLAAGVSIPLGMISDDTHPV